MSFDNTPIPAENILGSVGEGYRVSRTSMNLRGRYLGAFAKYKKVPKIRDNFGSGWVGGSRFHSEQK